MKYPRIWKHKVSKKKIQVMPWWEMVKDGEIEEADELGNLVATQSGRPCKFGLLVQIGYLIENENGIYIGVDLTAAKHFKDMGEVKRKVKI